MIDVHCLKGFQSAFPDYDKFIVCRYRNDRYEGIQSDFTEEAALNSINIFKDQDQRYGYKHQYLFIPRIGANLIFDRES